MGKKLYVGNLTYGVSDSLWSIVLSVRNRAERQVIQDRARVGARGSDSSRWTPKLRLRQRSKGLHDQEHDGRRLTVNEAKPREDRGGGGGGYGGGGGRSWRSRRRWRRRRRWRWRRLRRAAAADVIDRSLAPVADVLDGR